MLLDCSTGKLYHPAHPKNGDGNASWSQLPQQFSCTNQPVGLPGTYCNPDAPGCTTIGTKTAPNPRWCSVDLPINGSGPDGPELADAKTVADGLMKLQYAIATRARTVKYPTLPMHLHGNWDSAFDSAVRCRAPRILSVLGSTSHIWTGACQLRISSIILSLTRFHSRTTAQPSVVALQCRFTALTRAHLSRRNGKAGGMSTHGRQCATAAHKR